jgi:hypothetical protein
MELGVILWGAVSIFAGGYALTKMLISYLPHVLKAYFNRALLKYQKLNDLTGAIQDFRST